ncbi:hypothetical protein C8R43DRAFT_961311 [Mycena crocata]|nr:hypothetical protein C8R43DRAFT_961311 [Mycena crocata]
MEKSKRSRGGVSELDSETPTCRKDLKPSRTSTTRKIEKGVEAKRNQNAEAFDLFHTVDVKTASGNTRTGPSIWHRLDESLETVGDDAQDGGMNACLDAQGQEPKEGRRVGRGSGEGMITPDGGVPSCARVDLKKRDEKWKGLAKERRKRKKGERRTEKGWGETILLDSFHEVVAFAEKVGVAASPEVLDEPVGVCPVAVGNTENHARRARDAGLRKRAGYAEFSAIGALGNDLGERKEKNVVLDQLGNPPILNAQGRVRDVRELSVALVVKRNNEGIVRGRQQRQNEAFRRGAGGGGGARRGWSKAERPELEDSEDEEGIAKNGSRDNGMRGKVAAAVVLYAARTRLCQNNGCQEENGQRKMNTTYTYEGHDEKWERATGKPRLEEHYGKGQLDEEHEPDDEEKARG